jgi:hypothetical protein
MCRRTHETTFATEEKSSTTRTGRVRSIFILNQSQKFLNRDTTLNTRLTLVSAYTLYASHDRPQKGKPRHLGADAGLIRTQIVRSYADTLAEKGLGPDDEERRLASARYDATRTRFLSN